MGKEKLVVEVIGAHNLMPKDGEGSSSPFVEVTFENQINRTQTKSKDLNPVWNELLVFDVSDSAVLPYRIIDVSIYNQKIGHGRKFLGKTQISGSSVANSVQEHPQPQLYSLEKRSFFSHIRGDISLKIYLSQDEPGRQIVVQKKMGKNTITAESQKQNPLSLPKQQKQIVPQQKQQQLEKGSLTKPAESNPIQLKPVVVAPPGANPVHPSPSYVQQNHDFVLKATTRPSNREKTNSAYDLVEQMPYLYCRLVRARDIHCSCDVVAEVKLGNYRGVTKRVGPNVLEWNQVFAFSKDCIQSSTLEILVKEREKADFLGRVPFELSEVPKRVPPDSPLAPQWYRMDDKKGDKTKGEIMVSVWFGTQADETFSEAWHSKAATVNNEGLSSIKSKVYLSPKLWYLRVTIIEAQDIFFTSKCSLNCRFPELYAKAQIGNQMLRTRSAIPVSNRNISNPQWNEDLMFVVAEPFEDYLMISIEDRIGPCQDETLGRIFVPVSSIEKRTNELILNSKWFGLDSNYNFSVEPKMRTRFGSRIHLKLSLDGAYHVLDESTMYTSDLRPTSKELWKPSIGVLEIGILGATGLIPMKMKEMTSGVATTDAYCVAKYGQKWVRTRTVIDSLSPKWNEQYTWEVFDPCTVLTIAVFDNCHIHKNLQSGIGIQDTRIGKIWIRLSTLESDRVYAHSYPLLMLHPTGVKKMGELHLAVRFSCTNFANLLTMYSSPMLPNMHYLQPLSVRQVEILRYQAVNVVAMRLSRAEPPLGKEVVEYMLDHNSHIWSMRRSKVNFFRLVSVFSVVFSIGKWLELVHSWEKPVHSLVFTFVFLGFAFYPELILPTALLCIAFIGLWRYRCRPNKPPHIDTRLSQAEAIFPDELDEELDTCPSSRNSDVIRGRYDRIRSVAGRIQMVVGDLAMQGERLQSLISWRDPRATFLFLVACFMAALIFYAVPFKVTVVVFVGYILRPPRFRSRLPSPLMCFFRRLPSKADVLL